MFVQHQQQRSSSSAQQDGSRPGGKQGGCRGLITYILSRLQQHPGLPACAPYINHLAAASRWQAQVGTNQRQPRVSVCAGLMAHLQGPLQRSCQQQQLACVLVCVQHLQPCHHGVQRAAHAVCDQQDWRAGGHADDAAGGAVQRLHHLPHHLSRLYDWPGLVRGAGILGRRPPLAGEQAGRRPVQPHKSSDRHDS